LYWQQEGVAATGAISGWPIMGSCQRYTRSNSYDNGVTTQTTNRENQVKSKVSHGITIE